MGRRKTVSARRLRLEKLASKLKKQGRKVLIAAADTFRAAAGDQLEEWANRAGVDMIGGVEGSDPASVNLRRGQCGKSASCGRPFMRYGGTSPQ